MTKQSAFNIALALLLSSLPLVSFGLAADQPLLVWIGLAAVLAGALLPPIARYAAGGKDDQH